MRRKSHVRFGEKGGETRLLRGRKVRPALTLPYTLIALVAGGAAVWAVFNAVAGRFNAIANGL